MSDTRAAILQVAEDLIRTRGYFGFSYSDIEAAVGIRKASIHHHFPTKAILVAAAVDAYSRQYEAALVRIEAEQHHAIARIEAYADLYRQGLHRGLGCLCVALAADMGTLPPDLLSRVRLFFQAHVDWLTRVIVQGARKGEVIHGIDSGSVARLLVSTLEGAMLLGLVSGKPADFDDATGTVLRLLKT
ncbi:transcriptional regulator, TetR family [Paracoccus thiocyanatus]|uniref:Transcriptional regulator, TetR family n=1 Tax=Paracoccus thiocyanatus TaxID=34006 RepID=A0A1N6WIE0_9RHOB|nr:TetR/AcrR family transcriptional regulator [Paracoccus thiocyanatus]SIQ89788.1 transcriptional regulator, TetR family [Paracoccus thiocyanatus]